MMMKGFFQMDVGCLQIWVCLTFPLAELGRRQQTSHGPAGALPAENRWHFGPLGGAFTGVNQWVMVTLLEGVWVHSAAACSGPAPGVFPEV